MRCDFGHAALTDYTVRMCKHLVMRYTGERVAHATLGTLLSAKWIMNKTQFEAIMKSSRISRIGDRFEQKR